ncbi:MAG: RsmB/NOP family class I SAM-dependent RNA methyltransferase [Maritimibacter sp.]|uniref:RsmB/NOP family class I SAM-dependent RNA methyltransferase n=1 Tax=Maritimibacter sp. TaxID=2003363 RepID=UPI001E1488B4|nr:RsmB/NOP family class I SAM-dependent RNA methyltransferase [Maritimibacter sp.]MBL6428055.1 RsmB/NOP family class I SAM-dependent RNA methyltransferase [Maritimibacter sp.]
MAGDPNLPRRVALDLMGDVMEHGRLLPEVLPRRLEKLAPEDRARTQRLVATAFRVMDRADRVLGPHLRKRPPLRIHNILRLSVAEICELGAAPHGVVNTAVELARADKKTAGMAGLVNAILRKVDAEGWAALPTPRLPKWLRKPLTDDYGKDIVAAMETAFYAGAPLDLTPKGDAETLAQALGGTVLPTGSVRVTNAGQVSTLPGFAEGDWWVQDAAAALPARVLNAQPGETVLDLCAAPGGKTMQLAAAGAEVTAVDISEHRMARVGENLARCGLSADLVTMDALEYEGGPFDAILLDAPCTATGTIRRHPDLPYAKDGSDFPGLFELQEHLIDRALGMLKSGGRLIYCTCSLLIDEGEEQVRDALGRHEGLSVDTAALDRPGIDPDWRTDEGGLRLRPDYWADKGGMDGFYIACLVKA